MAGGESTFEGVVCMQRGRLLHAKVRRLREVLMDKVISTKEMKEKVDRKHATVVETLAAERFREAHIPGAINIPPEKIKELAGQLLPDTGSEIITYCTNAH